MHKTRTVHVQTHSVTLIKLIRAYHVLLMLYDASAVYLQ